MKRNWIIGISAFIAGLLLLISPTFCVKLILVLFGLTTIVEGFYGIITERTLFDNQFFQKTTLYKSIGNIVIGVLAIVMPLAIAGAAWAVMTYILAIYLIISACAGFIASSKLKQISTDEDASSTKQLSWENIITLASGVLLLVIGPAKLGSMILRIIGLVALIVGAGFILIQILDRKKEVKASNIEVKDDDSESPVSEDMIQAYEASQNSSGTAEVTGSDSDGE